MTRGPTLDVRAIREGLLPAGGTRQAMSLSLVRFHPGHALVAVGLFLVELYIALYVHDDMIRPYGGDVLVVPLIYHAIAAGCVIPPLRLGAGVLVFAFLIEFLQYIRIVDRLGLSDHTIAATVIGTHFSALDLVAYSLGALLSVSLHQIVNQRQSPSE